MHERDRQEAAKEIQDSFSAIKSRISLITCKKMELESNTENDPSHSNDKELKRLEEDIVKTPLRAQRIRKRNSKYTDPDFETKLNFPS